MKMRRGVTASQGSATAPTPTAVAAGVALPPVAVTHLLRWDGEDALSPPFWSGRGQQPCAPDGRRTQRGGLRVFLNQPTNVPREFGPPGNI